MECKKGMQRDVRTLGLLAAAPTKNKERKKKKIRLNTSSVDKLNFFFPSVILAQ